MMKRLLLVLAAVVVVALISCHLLLPERFAVNAPIAHMLFGRGGGAPDLESIGARLRVPSGFSLSIYAEGIPATARALQFTASGDLLVSTPHRYEAVRRLRWRSVMSRGSSFQAEALQLPS